MSTIELILRLVCVVQAIPVIWLSWRGFIAYGMGHQWIDNGLRAISFLVAVSVISFQIVLIGNMDSEAVFIPLITMSAALAVCLIKLLRLGPQHTEELERLSMHFDVTLAIADLADVDPESANRLAGEARRLTAIGKSTHDPC